MAIKDLRINEEILVKEVRLVDAQGEQSVVPIQTALAMAQEASLDLVEVSPTAVPPVCRILDYGKYKFEQEKRIKESKKKQKIIKLKEVRMQPKISKHDLEFKARHVQEFLNEGNKVKVTVRFKGRELAHTDLGRILLYRMLDIIVEIAKETKGIVYTLEQEPKMEGRNMHMMLAPKKE
jgi:translation initiation factor IF-3